MAPTTTTATMVLTMLLMAVLGLSGVASFTLMSPIRTMPLHSRLGRGRDATFAALGYQKKGPMYETDEKRSLSVLNTALVSSTDDSSSSFTLYALSTTTAGGTPDDSQLQNGSSFWGPRLLLAAVACIYGTNFALGAVMNDALPASAATCARMVLAGLALSPFIPRLKPSLILTTLLGGCFTSMGYVTQSLALTDTSPATVSFLGSCIVLVCPLLQYFVDKKPMGWKDAPQTWIAAILCLAGVGVLELCDPHVAVLSEGLHMGHVLALLQAVGFGTGLFLSSKMVHKHPDQALPVTAVIVAVTAFVSMFWSMWDGWMLQPGWQSMALPRVLTDAPSWQVAAAVLWTGLLSTSLNYCLETMALAKVPSAEASVILATEPLWAALFAALLLNEQLGWNDTVGGILIVAACLANTLEPSKVHRFFGHAKKE